MPNAQGHPTHELAVDGLDHNGFTLLSVYSFDATLTPTLRSSTRSSITSGLNLSVVAAGRLGCFGQQDQLVYASSTNGFNSDGINRNLVVITFDTNLNMTLHQVTLPGYRDSHFVYPFGLAVGRFNPTGREWHTESEPPDCGPCRARAIPAPPHPAAKLICGVQRPDRKSAPSGHPTVRVARSAHRLGARASGSSVTSGSVSTQAFDVLSVLIASKINIGGFGADLSGGFDYNSSSSVSTLNESSSSKLGSSTGIKIVKPSFVDPGHCAYTAQTYIFGQQSTHRYSAGDFLGHHGAVEDGPLWRGVSGGPHRHTQWRRGWWEQAYTKPDVALNHPATLDLDTTHTV